MLDILPNKLVKCIRLWLLALLPVQGLAQVKTIPQGYWEDDYNIRIHASYYLLGNTLHDVPRYMPANPGFNLAGIFKYDAIKTSRYKTVKVIEKRGKWNVLLAGKLPSALALYMDTLMEDAEPQNTQWLNYDANGYLIRRVIDYYNANPLYSKRDTTLYQYQYGAGGLVKTTMTTHSKTVNGNKKPDKEWPFFYASIYCGEIKKGPYTLNSEGREEYSFDLEGRIVEVRYYYKAFANSCRDYDPDNATVMKFVYNQKRWLASVSESAINSGQIRRRETFDYKDIHKKSVPLFETPLMKQYLSTIDSPEFSLVNHVAEYWGRGDGKTYYPIDSPQVATEQYITMRNDKNELCLSVQLSSDGKPQHPTIYKSGEDSLGAFRLKAEVNAGEEDTDNTVYNPAIPLKLTSTTSGCIKAYYYEKPAGTWQLNDFDCSDRKVIKGEDGWAIIAYSPYGSRNMAGMNSFFAPMQFTGCSRSLDMKNFVLIDPDGDVRYVYDDGFIYKMIYE